MKIVLVIAIHLVLWTQNAEGKEITPINHNVEHLFQNRFNLIKSKEISTLDVNRLLSINDLWNKIKTSIANAWDSIKDIANKTKDKIKVWIQDIKQRAEEVVKYFHAKLELLKEKLNTFIQAIKNTAEDMKQCIQQDKDSIQDLLKQITTSVTTCIANSVKQTSVLDSYQLRLTLNDTEFMKGAEDKINGCIQNLNDAEECLNNARGAVYDDIENTENSIMETRSISRNFAEDILETISACAAEGIIEASETITEEVLNVINCVVNEKEKPFSLNKFHWN